MFAVPDPQSLPTPSSHAGCMVCGDGSALGLQFNAVDDDAVTATVVVDPCWQGYPGVVHGGMVSTLLDAAMTHCLFRQGVEAMTASLNVRFHESVPCASELVLRARLNKRRRHVFFLDAEIACRGRLLACAEARFIRPDSVSGVERA